MEGFERATGEPEPHQNRYRFGCVSAAGSHYDEGVAIPNCASGETLTLGVFFPQCWDGRNLDSPDHKSHMAFAYGGVDCPPSHPVLLPNIGFNAEWKLPAGVTGAQLRLSSDSYSSSLPGGYSMHGDWFNGWNPAVSEVWINNCIRASRDCHGHLLGDGRTLY